MSAPTNDLATISTLAGVASAVFAAVPLLRSPSSPVNTWIGSQGNRAVRVGAALVVIVSLAVLFSVSFNFAFERSSVSSSADVTVKDVHIGGDGNVTVGHGISLQGGQQDDGFD